MSNNTAVTQTTNIVPVQGVFAPEPSFALQYFVGPAGTPFLPPTSPFLDGVTITNSTINSTTIGATSPSTGNFTNIATTTGTISTTPSGDTDIANKGYVDSVAQGLDVKASCVYSTTNIVTLAGLGTQLGGDWASSLTDGDRILVKNQANAAQNGIYVASASTWSRSADMNTWAEVPSAFTFIESGTTLADTGWVCTSNQGGTIGVTAINWSQFSGAGSYLAGDGLQLTGNTFSVKANGTTLDVSASGVKISDTYAGQTSITTLGTIATGTWNGSTIAVNHGGSGATTLTGYLKGNGTSAFTSFATIPTTDLSGTITNAQLANSTISGVSLGSNLFALTIGSGLSGTSYNGSAAVTITNSSPMVYPGSGIPNSTGSSWGTSYSTSGSGDVVLTTGATLSNPTISNYEVWTSSSAPSYAEGRQWYDSTAHSLAYYNDSSTSIVHIGQDLILKVINNTGSTIPNGSPVYITGTSSGQTYPNVALAKADVAATSAVIGLTNGAITNGSIGYVTSQGGIDGVNTGTFTVGQVLYLSPYSAGQLMNTIPPTGITVQVGVVSYVDSSAGKIYVKQTTPLAVPASIITGQVALANGGTSANLTAVSGGVVYSTASALAILAVGTSGQVLTSNGTSAPSWTTPTAYATVTDDTTTNAVRYPLFANQTTGNLTTEYVSSTKLNYNPSSGLLTATGFSGSGASLTSLPAGQLSGTIPSGVLGNSSLYIGTTSIALNRSSSAQSLTGVNIDGSAGSATTAGTATNANNVAITDDTTTASDMYLSWVTSTTGNLPIKVSSTKLKFNPSTGVLTATGGVLGGTF
jgi:hypothetical protein